MTGTTAAANRQQLVMAAIRYVDPLIGDCSEPSYDRARKPPGKIVTTFGEKTLSISWWAGSRFVDQLAGSSAKRS